MEALWLLFQVRKTGKYYQVWVQYADQQYKQSSLRLRRQVIPQLRRAENSGLQSATVDYSQAQGQLYHW